MNYLKFIPINEMFPRKFISRVYLHGVVSLNSAKKISDMVETEFSKISKNRFVAPQSLNSWKFV